MTAGYGYSATAHSGMPDPLVYPELYEGLLPRRVLAYFIDLICIGAIMAVVGTGFAILWLLSLGCWGRYCGFCSG